MTVVQATKAGPLDVGAHANVVAGNAAATDYFYMPNDGKTVLVCVCGAAAKQLTFTAVACEHGRTETHTPTPTSSGTTVLGPFPPALWNQSNGCVKFQPAAGGLATDKYLAVRVG
jgi:hypothetical protein